MLHYDLREYKTEDGYEDDEGCRFEEADGLLQSILGFCACGQAETVLEYVMGGLSLIQEVTDANRDSSWHAFYEDWKARETAHHGTEGARWLFYYWADSEGWTEHGSSVPGWLTEEGEKLLHLLKQWKDQQP